MKMRILGVVTLALLALAFIPTGHVFAATRRAQDGATNFLMNNGLSVSSSYGTGMVNGASSDLSSDTITGGVTSVFLHTLFAEDGNGNITVYTPGNSPATAQVSQNADGSIGIAYNENTNSFSSTFSGTLAGDQMTATYSQQTWGGTTLSNDDGSYQQFDGGTNLSATFTATVNWVSSDQIPETPTGGQYQLTSDGGVALSWSPSGNAVSYDIYRMVLGRDTQQLLLTNTTNTSYTDESSDATQNAQTVTGIMYTIYAVGPTGVENPTDVVIAPSSSVF